MIQFIGVVGIALATGLVGWFQLALLYHGLRKQENFKFDARFKRVVFKIIFSALLMGVVLLVVDKYIDVLESKILTLAALVALGLMSYGLSIITTKAITIDELKRYLPKNKKA